jgi:hypothetical protein
LIKSAKGSMRPYRFRLVLSFFFLFLFHASAVTLYVSLNSTNPMPPYTDWSTAATNIQDAVDASTNGDLILVTNGLYQTGGRAVYNSLTNRVVVNGAISVQSVNGPSVTVIKGNSVLGSSAVRCVFMSTNSVLSGFTLTNGGTLSSGDFVLDESGGGVWTTNNSIAVVSNCVLIGNVAQGMGGGEYNGTIYNSSIIQNSAYDGGGVGCEGISISVVNSLIASNTAQAYGGGAWGAVLKNCSVLQNTAGYGGGAEGSSLYGCLVVSNVASIGGAIDVPTTVVANCTIIGNSSLNTPAAISGGGSFVNSIIYHNTGMNGSPSNYDSGTFFYCCTTPMPQNSVSTITNDPGFIDYTGGNFHLGSNSPCINSGTSGAYTATDLDGNPRIVGGTVDIGAYEYQTPTSILSYAWAQQYGLPTDGSADYADPDGDGMNNYQEWIAGTNPTNALSVLALLPPTPTNNPAGLVVSWQSVNQSGTGHTYFLQRGTNLEAQPAFSTIVPHITGKAGTTSYTDTRATNSGPYFYRVGVQ